MGDSDDREISYNDLSVREILTEMKDISEVMVDLAYASLMYDSEDMAEKVRELEAEMDELKYAIRFKTLLAARTRDDARQLSGLLQVASAADKVSDAAGDIVDLLDVPLEKRPFISAMLYQSDEKIRATKIMPNSSMVGYTIKQLAVEACTGCRIIAIKNRHGWTYDPEADVKIRAGDDIIVRGTEDGYVNLTEFAKGSKEWEFPEISEEEEEETVEEEAASINEEEEP